MLERMADGLQFSIADRRYHVLSPLQRHPGGHVVLTLALYHGASDACLHQDQVQTDTAKGHLGFALRCHALKLSAIGQDLPAPDAMVRQTLNQEVAQDNTQVSTTPPRCGRIEQGEVAYDRAQTAADSTEERTCLSSFIVVSKLRVSIDGAQAICVDLKLQQQTVTDVIFERYRWHSHGLLMKALLTLDLWCVASTKELQSIRGIVGSKAVPRKYGAGALGYWDGGFWVTPNDVLDLQGWIADPPVLYLPHGGVCPLADSVRYQVGSQRRGWRSPRP